MEYKLGEQLAHADVPVALSIFAAKLARDFYARQLESHFSEQVDTMAVPRGFQALQKVWMPSARLHEARFRYTRGRQRPHWVLTTGVESHVDDAFGPTLLWTMYNDGLEFWQKGGARRTPAPGDVLIFDDGVPHSMDLTRAQQKDPRFEEAVWIGWAIPLDGK